MAENPEFDDPGTGIHFEIPSGFRAAFTHALSEFGYTVTEWEATGVNVLAPIERGEIEDRKHFIGLSNLYRRDQAAERTEWPALIREFLNHIAGSVDESAIPDDLTNIAEKLRPRLGLPFSHEA